MYGTGHHLESGNQLDGFICDEDGGFAWISGQGDVRADTADHFDFDGFLASCDTIVMGRKAYEDCLSSLPEAAEKRFLWPPGHLGRRRAGLSFSPPMWWRKFWR